MSERCRISSSVSQKYRNQSGRSGQVQRSVGVKRQEISARYTRSEIFPRCQIFRGLSAVSQRYRDSPNGYKGFHRDLSRDLRDSARYAGDQEIRRPGDQEIKKV